MGNVWLETVVPVLGGIVALFLFGSPVKAALDVRREGKIGDLNPLPFIFIIANCASWVAYSYVITNWYLFVPNWLGLVIGAFLFCTSYGVGIADISKRDRLAAVLLFMVAVIPWVGAVERLILTAHDDQKHLWGYFANTVLFLFYMSPLSTMASVIKDRDSSSLTLPLCAMNIANGALWFTYGLAVNDAFVWVPNGTGAVLGVLQTSLCFIFPRKATLQKTRSTLPLTHYRSGEDAAPFEGATVTSSTAEIEDRTDRSAQPSHD